MAEHINDMHILPKLKERKGNPFISKLLNILMICIEIMAYTFNYGGMGPLYLSL